MSEANLISQGGSPVTTASMVHDLQRLGSAEGGVVIVHSSLSALGWVAGGAQAVVEALLAWVGADGTIVMPTQSGLSDPASWSNPPVPADWVETIRAHMPAYDPYLTPTRQMGQIVDCFRQLRATLRSDHPTWSFAAHGRHAADIVGTHLLSAGFGEGSPLGRMYENDAQILLLGVGHANNTSLHLAEYRATWPGKSRVEYGSPVRRDGGRQWVTYEDLDLNEDDFERIGDAFAATGRERVGQVGAAPVRLCRQRELVDFAVEWMQAHRGVERDGAE